MSRYPVYVISKGRHDACLTAKFLTAEKTLFSLVVEPQEEQLYRKSFPAAEILVLPFSNLGLGSIPARNWVWDHSKAAGHERHWILDDNIREVRRRWQGRRIPCNADLGFSAIEDFVDRYTNVGIGGMAYYMFVPNRLHAPAFYLNVHVYSCLLIRNDLPMRWRGRYNEDTDLTLQVLAGGWCTVLVNAFMINKVMSMVMKGGNMTELYKGDGRLRMARSLERMWPEVVTVQRRYKRPQHVKNAWRNFDTQLIPRPDAGEADGSRYKMSLKILQPIQSDGLKAVVDEWNRTNSSSPTAAPAPADPASS